jgi:nitrite reductase/ring-hydroxylating ferredoxin subunit
MSEYMTIGPATVGEGDVAGFDIEGAEMGELDGKELECECHGSVFDVTTGAVLDGPATVPLEVYPTREVDGNVEIEV